jgi:hypothetical protein
MAPKPGSSKDGKGSAAAAMICGGHCHHTFRATFSGRHGKLGHMKAAQEPSRE